MRKRKTVAKLNRTASHRKAMLRNMATSLFDHERVVTTRAKAKVLRSYSEKLITRAKENLGTEITPHRALHNKREVINKLADEGIVKKLFEEIAPRFKERKGGYTRIIHLPERLSDSSMMSIVELVDRKEKIRRERAPRQKKVGVGSGTGAGDSKKSETRGDRKSVV